MCRLKARVPKALTAPPLASDEAVLWNLKPRRFRSGAAKPTFVNESTDATTLSGGYAVPNYSNVMFVFSPSCWPLNVNFLCGTPA
jgi:hypothetical protein